MPYFLTKRFSFGTIDEDFFIKGDQVLDFLFLITIILKFFCPYVEKTQLVKSYRNIAIRYILYSFYEFYLQSFIVDSSGLKPTVSFCSKLLAYFHIILCRVLTDFASLGCFN